ncbi:hypothetical protein J6590_010325 [Homalodisca vitripennis]|nr:hypothetical protein J6590_010325 [Homalodisca vitripennis]
MELLELCTQCNYFELQGKIYHQDEGMAMGSPLSPIFANIFMEEFERKALASAQFKPKILWRYSPETHCSAFFSPESLLQTRKGRGEHAMCADRPASEAAA